MLLYFTYFTSADLHEGCVLLANFPVAHPGGRRGTSTEES